MLSRSTAVLVSAGLLTMALGCSEGGSSGPVVDGAYSVTAINCNGVPAASGAISTWITAPSSMRFEILTNGTSTQVFSNGSCSITSSFTTSVPSSGSLSMAGTGTFACSGTCAAYSTQIYGSDVCGDPNTYPASVYTVSPAAGVVAGQALTITAPGSDTACSSSGNTDPASYVGTKQ